jgi:hypothetical protein
MSIVQDYKNSGVGGLIKGISIKIFAPIIVLILSNKLLQNYRTADSFNYTWNYEVENKTAKINNFHSVDNKQRGIHVFHLGEDLSDIETLKTNNFEWITLTPFISQKEYNQPTIRLLSKERAKSRKAYYQRIKNECDRFGMKIMLKPHIWLNKSGNGKWRSDIEMVNDSDWDVWFDSYQKNIFIYAEIAQELQFEQFCIGTELETTVKIKPEKWKDLISKVKFIYSGKITYAANWNQEFKDIPFWDQLDYIGIQAYFPLSENAKLNIEALQDSWQPHIKEMSALSKKFNKPILFTEIGYRSLQGTSRAPWEWSSLKHYFYKISKEEQLLCYQAFFNIVWKEPWFHGMHIWEWQGSYSDGNNTDFTLESKPALNVIAKEFQNNIQ